MQLDSNKARGLASQISIEHLSALKTLTEKDICI